MPAKGQLSLKLLVQIIIFIALFFIAHRAWVALQDFWLDKPHSGTLNSAERIQIEIDNMVRDENEVPLFIDAKHQINGFIDGKSSRKCENGEPCICICKLDSICLENNVIECFQLATEPETDFVCKPRFEGGETIDFNGILAKKEDKVSVSC